MPFKSQAQRRFFYAAEARGELPKGTAKRWQKETGKKKLPERVREKTAAWDMGVSAGMAKVAGVLKKVKKLPKPGPKQKKFFRDKKKKDFDDFMTSKEPLVLGGK